MTETNQVPFPPVEEPKEIKEELAKVPPPQTIMNLDEMKVAYVVGLDALNNPIFKIHGTDTHIMAILGLHEFANRQVNMVYNNKAMVGDRLIHEVGKAITNLHQKVDKLSMMVGGNRT